MSLEYERLISLIEFAQQSAKLKTSPFTTIGQHKAFLFHEHQMQGMLGVHLNTEDEVWLSVERLHETRPPELNALLQPWVEMTHGVDVEPKLKTLIVPVALGKDAPVESNFPNKLEFLVAKAKWKEATDNGQSFANADPKQTVLLADFPQGELDSVVTRL